MNCCWDSPPVAAAFAGALALAAANCWDFGLDGEYWRCWADRRGANRRGESQQQISNMAEDEEGIAKRWN